MQDYDFVQMFTLLETRDRPYDSEKGKKIMLVSRGDYNGNWGWGERCINDLCCACRDRG